MKQKLLSFILLLTCLIGTVYAQNRQVSGKVVNAFGDPIAGVTVIVHGQTLSTQTNNYGDYRIHVNDGDVLTFRALGFESKIVRLGNGNVYDVSLTVSSRDLDEVVVTAYGVQNKESIVGSVVSVSAADIEKRPVTSATAALEGMAPGLQISNSYGEPGSSPGIRIRGYASLNGNNAPAIVLDGVLFGGNISDINTNDIESMSILKDATSAGLYGNRAAAGVIVITTKRGKSGANVNLVVNQGIFTRGVDEYEKLDPKQFMEATWQGYRNQLRWNNAALTEAQANEQATKTLVPSILKLNIFNKPADALFDQNGKMLSDASILGDYGDDLDWFKPIMRNGYRQEYNLGGNGGAEKANYLFSVGYLDEEAYIISSEFTRISGRLSAEVRPTDWFKAGMSANAGHQLSNFTTGDGSGFVNPWNYARNIAPIYPVHLHDPITGLYALDDLGNKQYDDGTISRNQYAGRHIIWETELNSDITKRNTVNSQAYFDFNILSNLKLSLIGDLNLRYSEERSYENAIIGDGAGNFGRGGREIYNYKNYTLRQQLNYNVSIGGAHNFDVLAAHENYGNTYTYLYARKAGEIFAGMPELINYNNITSLYDQTDNDKTDSYLGRVRYNFNEKYFLDAGLRFDGTSRLHIDKRWGNFWNLGGTWMVSKETFMQDAVWIDDLKLRAATGVVGNVTSAGLYGWMAKYAIGQNNNLPAFYKSSYGNPELLWEGSQSSSFALEGRIFDRLNFIVEYFDKRSKDLIFDVNQALSNGSTTNSSGIVTVTQNIGDISNKGFEFTFDADLIRNQDLVWNLGLNATFLKNKVEKLPEQNRENGIISSPFKYMEGRTVYDYWLPQYKGVDMMTGQALYVADTKAYDPTLTTGAHYSFQQEVNGTMYTRNASYAVRDYVGSAVPDVMGAVNSFLRYKSFSLSAIMMYSLGGKGVDYSYNALMGVTSTPNAVHKDVLKSWTGIPEGMTATSEDRINVDATPQINYATSQYNNTLSSRFVFDNTYVVLKNIAIGYKMPQNMVSQLKLRTLSLNCAVENLATLTGRQGYSPQQTFGGYSQNEFVPARVFSFGFNIGI